MTDTEYRKKIAYCVINSPAEKLWGDLIDIKNEYIVSLNKRLTKALRELDRLKGEGT